jgi:thioredoxin reductase (NADPH)
MLPVTVYTSTGCVYCTRLKDWLKEREISFEERNVTENPAYMDELAKLGIFTSPVAIIGETPVVGFRPNKMSELLGLARA